MRKYDHLVFHAGEYRDINFARQHDISHYSIISNGASQVEFEENIDNTFRRRYGIPEREPLLLTVGSHTGQKGHRLSIETFQRLKSGRATLVIIGNIFHRANFWDLFLLPLLHHIRYFRVRHGIKLIVRSLLGGIHPGCLPECRIRTAWTNLRGLGRKRVLLLDPPRADVVAAYHAADLFVFGSNIEYSPLVLFEAAASRTPFVTLECGNSKEIVEWTGGGVIAPTFKLEDGSVDGNPELFARTIEELLMNTQKRMQLAQSGYTAWRERFTWEKIALQYEALYQELIK
jgi:glycosyltransferase involved in cell wall biosynthesis